MDYQEGLVYASILFLIVTLYKEWFRPSVSFFIVILILLVGDVITPKQALSGFSNEQLVIIVLLLILGSVFKRLSRMEGLFGAMIGSGQQLSPFKWKTYGSIGVFSAFLNNTPLVAFYLPYVLSWTRKNGFSASKVLIPLSYMSILGGCVTLIGTSTNLIVNGLAIEYGQPSLEIFDFAPVGIVMFILGFIYLFTVGDRLLPNREAPSKQMEDARQYFIETNVDAGSRLAGRSVTEAGLRNLKGLFLVEVIREGKSIRPVSPGEILQEEDRLIFAGDPESINDITRPGLGLSLPKACDLPDSSSGDIVEVVVGHNARIVGMQVKESDFRGRYNGAILAIHRNGERLTGKIGQHVLQAGDVLLVLTGDDFDIRMRNNPGFYILSTVKESEETSLVKTYLFIAGFLAAIGLTFAGVSLMVSLSVLLLLCIVTELISPNEIRNSIDFNLILIIAMGLALGKGMIMSGAAERIADSLKYLPETFGVLSLLPGIFLITNLLASIITSKAAVAVTLPVALSLAAANQVPSESLVLAVAFGGAANFLTPIGYQTNIMVYGPGGYRFRDFFSVGLPLTIMYVVVTTLILGYTYEYF